jgi:DNA-binding NarL/FixJ family response regulator
MAIIAYHLCGIRLELGDPRGGEQMLAQALEVAEAANFRFLQGRLAVLRAVFAERAGKHRTADVLLAEAVAAERAIDSQPGMIDVLTSLGAVLFERGQRARAAEPLREALALAAAHGSLVRLARVLEVVSGLLVDSDPVASVRLAAAGQALRDTMKAPPRPSERERLERCLEQAKHRLGQQVYAETWRAARVLPTAAVVDEGRMLLNQVLAPDAPRPRMTAVSPLTPREREVVILLTHGLNNREIGDELVITRKTAEAHVNHILSKLNLTSRLQIVAWAYEHGLALPPAAATAEDGSPRDA